MQYRNDLGALSAYYSRFHLYRVSYLGASGDERRDILDGYYITLAGYTGYVNLIHVKPVLRIRPTPKLSLLSAVGLQWRETTADAVYVLRAKWAITRKLAGAIEVVIFQVGEALRRARGHDVNYLGVELNYGW